MRITMLAGYLIIAAGAGCGAGGGQPTGPPAQGPPPPPDPARTVIIDDAHHNYHTLRTGYAEFGGLASQLGYTVISSGEPFSPSSLARGRMLVIVNALHASNVGSWTLPTPSAFAGAEIEAVRQWVHGGGALLLIADHMPWPGAAEELAAAFGVTFNNGFAYDPQFVSEPLPCLRGPQVHMFRRADGTLADHPITLGRHAAERLDSIAVFTGQAFHGDSATTSFLRFGENARSIMPRAAWVWSAETPTISVAGWAQGAAREYDAGRIVFLGEAAVFTSQTCGADQAPMGWNAPQAGQNRQLAANIIRWLMQEY